MELYRIDERELAPDQRALCNPQPEARSSRHGGREPFQPGGGRVTAETADRAGRITYLKRDPAEAAPAAERRPKTTLAHRILLTFHEACDARDIEVAMRLLKILETIATAQSDAEPHERTRALRGLVAAHERLWALRFGDLDDPDRVRR